MVLEWLWDALHPLAHHPTAFWDDQALQRSMDDIRIGRRHHAATAEAASRELADLRAAHKAIASLDPKRLPLSEMDTRPSSRKAPGGHVARLAAAEAEERPRASVPAGMGKCSFFPDARSGGVPVYQCCNKTGCHRAPEQTESFFGTRTHNDLLFKA
ncbi:TY5A [Symbiodinium sp. KB8]|nr:TY5A [Symbiodinium sp. KB8]